jgi:membrane dipeptidase
MWEPTRRELLASAALSILGLPLQASCRAEPSTLPEEVLALHRECRVLDLHLDTALWMRVLGYEIGQRHRNLLPTSPFGFHFDLPRASEGGLDAAVFGLVINPVRVHGELILPLKALAALESGSGLAQTLATLDLLERTAAQHPDRFTFATRGSEVARAMAQGRFAALAGLEGAHGIEADVANLTRAHQHGLRMLGLVHFQASAAARPMTVAAFQGKGLTPFGRDLVAESERLGVVVDLAHVNRAGVSEVLSIASRPPVVSHTACRALHDHARNLDDDQIRSIAEHGGVIGVAASRFFLGPGGLERFLDHIEHVIGVGGVDSAAIGSDWDGFIVPVSGMEDVTCLPRITAGLLARGHPEDTVRKVMGENALRVLIDVTG